MFWYILVAVAVFIFGVITGAGIVLTINLYHNAGVMNVFIPQYSDEQPYVCPEFTKGANFVCRKKYVLFDVRVRDLNSHQ